MSGIDILGFGAGTLTTLSFIPQVIKTWKTGSTKDFSLLWLITFIGGVGMWLVYGFYLGSIPIIAANSATLILVTLVLIIKLQNKT